MSWGLQFKKLKYTCVHIFLTHVKIIFTEEEEESEEGVTLVLEETIRTVSNAVISWITCYKNIPPIQRHGYSKPDCTSNRIDVQPISSQKYTLLLSFFFRSSWLRNCQASSRYWQTSLIATVQKTKALAAAWLGWPAGLLHNICQICICSIIFWLSAEQLNETLFFPLQKYRAERLPDYESRLHSNDKNLSRNNWNHKVRFFT